MTVTDSLVEEQAEEESVWLREDGLVLRDLVEVVVVLVFVEVMVVVLLGRVKRRAVATVILLSN
jgi:hypothetical protein